MLESEYSVKVSEGKLSRWLTGVDVLPSDIETALCYLLNINKQEEQDR